MFNTFYKPNIETINLNGQYQVKEKLSFGFIVKHDQQLIFIRSDKDFNQGSLVKILGNAIKVKNNSDFDLEKYLKTKRVFYEMKKGDLEFISLNYDWRYYFETYISTGGIWYEKYLPLMILGKYNQSSKDLMNLITNLNVLHLFVISGIHIGFFYKLFEKLAHKLKIPLWIYFAIFLFIFIGYLFLINFKIATLRAFIFICISFLNKNFWKSKFSKIDILAFTGLIFFGWNFYLIYDYSLIYAFVILLAIFTISKIRFRSQNIKNFSIALGAYLVAQTINVIFTKNVNLLGFFNVVLLTPIVMFSYLMVFSFFWQKELLDFYLLILDHILVLFNHFSFNISFNFMPTFIKVSSLIVIFGFLYSKSKK